MAVPIFSFLLLSTLSAIATAQCAASDHPNCANWASNGFCTNAGYSIAMIQQYCPRTCTNSGCVVATATLTSTGENVNCGRWANDATAVFCASPVITQSMKSFFCPTTCAAEIVQTDECAVYVQNGAQVVKILSKETTPLSSTKTGVTATNKVLNVYVKPTCKISFYAAAEPNLGDAHVADFTATTTQMFWRITAADNQVAGSFVCNCHP